MSEQQFASYLNQVIARLEDVQATKDDAERAERLQRVIASMKEDRDSNM